MSDRNKCVTPCRKGGGGAERTPSGGAGEGAERTPPGGSGSPAGKNFLGGLRCSLPIVLGYIPIGLALGLIARRLGLSALETGLMSALVYAGSSQFIALALLGEGAGGAAVVATTFLVNSRHILMSAGLAPHFRGVDPGFLSVLAFGITDETFAVNSVELERGGRERDEYFVLGLHLLAYLSWIVSTMAGVAVGEYIGSPERFGFDFALAAMFICLLIFRIGSAEELLVAVAAGSISLAIYLVLPGSWNIIVAGTAGATLGVVVEWLRRGF